MPGAAMRRGVPVVWARWARWASMSMVGRLPPLSMRAMEDWVVLMRRASSVWVSPAWVRRV